MIGEGTFSTFAAGSCVTNVQTAIRLAATKRLWHKRLPRSSSPRIDSAWLFVSCIDFAKRKAFASSIDSPTKARLAATQLETVSSGL
jgi:hypothetical protein